ncbi:MAG: multiheme c-type cytochrome [Bacteroidia bacterium]|nr:multiheme c-type cytochrome [Bacteroidia bacterium]
MKKQSLLLAAATTFFLCVFVNVTVAQDYVGSQSCAMCHNAVHTDWKASGHPYKLQKLSGGQPPAYPAGLSSRKQVGPQVDYTIQPGVPQPPQGYSWDQIGWVLGGYHSNARFLDTEGYVIIGPAAQYNRPTNRYVNYEQATPGKKRYDFSCYRCHTTGASKDKTPAFEAFPGIEGSWAETGVGCEGCHGPGSAHVANPTNKPPKDGLATCNNCHARDRTDTNQRVEWLPMTVNSIATGFIRHREQGDMMAASQHGKGSMTCATCHNPHKSVYYEAGGIKAAPNCQTCHPSKSIPGHTAATCTDCHMPKAARNADGLSPYVSEQSAHFWKILTDPITRFDNLDTTFVAGKKYISVDGDGLSGMTLDYTCLQCHVSQDVTWASGYAKDIHTIGVSVENVHGLPTAFGLTQNFPNPFNPSTTIGYNVPVRTHVRLEVLDSQGRLITTLVDQTMEPGRYNAVFHAESTPSGIYFYRMQSQHGPTLSKKMALVK